MPTKVIPDPPIVVQQYVTPRYPPTLAELFALVAALEAAGYDVGPRVQAAEAVYAAINNEPSVGGTIRHLEAGLIDQAPDAVARLVRAAGVDVASAEATGRVAAEFAAQLAIDLAAAIRDASGTIIAAMRPAFTAALVAVTTAAKAGLTVTSDPPRSLSREPSRRSTPTVRYPQPSVSSTRSVTSATN